MKLWILMAALALVATACASTKEATKPTLEDQVAQLTERVNALQGENQKLKDSRSRPAKTMLDPSIPPPAHRNIGGLPENFGWLHRAPDGCQSGPLSLRVKNDTAYHLRLFIDGKEIKVRGAVGLMPAVPPDEAVHVCLDGLGGHTIAGIAYISRYGRMVEVAKFSHEAHFGSHQEDGQLLYINRLWLP